jgi:hypothetical protein
VWRVARRSRPTTGPASRPSTTLKNLSRPGLDPTNRVSVKPAAIQVASFSIVEPASYSSAVDRCDETPQARLTPGGQAPDQVSSFDRAGASNHERTSRTKGRDASHFRGHPRGHQPTAQHHQAANAILTVIPPPVCVASKRTVMPRAAARAACSPTTWASSDPGLERVQDRAGSPVEAGAGGNLVGAGNRDRAVG